MAYRWYIKVIESSIWKLNYPFRNNYPIELVKFTQNWLGEKDETWLAEKNIVSRGTTKNRSPSDIFYVAQSDNLSRRVASRRCGRFFSKAYISILERDKISCRVARRDIASRRCGRGFMSRVNLEYNIQSNVSLTFILNPECSLGDTVHLHVHITKKIIINVFYQGKA